MATPIRVTATLHKDEYATRPLLTLAVNGVEIYRTRELAEIARNTLSQQGYNMRSHTPLPETKSASLGCTGWSWVEEFAKEF